MDLFLKIVGGFALGIGGLIALAVIFFIWRLRVAMKAIGHSVPTPNTVSLQEDSDAAWTRKPEATRALEVLVGLGYVRGPVYVIPEMLGVGVAALHHPDTGVHGCYYRHPIAGHWADFCATLSDGIELTVGNPPRGSEMDTRPNTRKIMLAGTPLPELHARLLQEISGQTLRVYHPENFKAEFEQAYAKDMAWRNAKGGTSEEEFRRVAANHKQEFTNEQLSDAFRETKSKEIQRWSHDIIEAFGKSTTLSVAEWKQYEGNMFILRDRFHAQGFLDYLDGILNLEESELGRYRMALDGGLSLTGLLGRISADTGHTVTKLGEVTDPQPTAIYGVRLAEKPAG